MCRVVMVCSAFSAFSDQCHRTPHVARYKLENGKFVVPGPIEDGLRLSSMYVAQAFIHGANKPHNVILIVPDFAACATELHLSGDDAKPASMVNNPKVRELVAQDLEYAAKNVKRWVAPGFARAVAAVAGFRL